MILKDISFSYGTKKIFEAFDIEIQDGAVTCIMANSGVGKTTLLNIIAGTLEPESGTVNEGKRLKVSYVFQEPRLLPSKTVFKNVSAVCKSKEQVEKMLEAVELKDASNLYPSELSGGMAQRVSMARAFVFPSDILLMDEPFKGLDIGLKYRQTELFKKLWKCDNRTVLTVTHDVDEAFEIASRIIILDGSPARVVKDVCVEQDEEKKEARKKELTKFLKEL